MHIKKVWVLPRTAVTASLSAWAPSAQTGTHIHPGTNVGIGSDDTLYALVDGTVKFEKLGKDRKKVSVYPVEQ